MLGLSLGLVFVPCAGPVLATITVVGADHHVGWSAVLLTVAFAVGVAVPLAGLRPRRASSWPPGCAAVRTHAATARRVIGAVLVVTALVLALNLTDGLQRAVPGYTDALQTQHRGATRRPPAALDGVTGRGGARGPGRLHRRQPGAAAVRAGPGVRRDQPRGSTPRAAAR